MKCDNCGQEMVVSKKEIKIFYDLPNLGDVAVHYFRTMKCKRCNIQKTEMTNL